MQILKACVALFFLVCPSIFGNAIAQSVPVKSITERQLINLSKNWSFIKDPANRQAVPPESLSWKAVNLPHTWNDKDVLDDLPGYYRGAGWYKKILKADRSWRSKSVYLCFDGANQETTVFVNGKKAGSHAGGYTKFIIPITTFLRTDGVAENVITVKVDNRFNGNIAPLTADFTFFGGLYRNVSLLVLNEVHFIDANYGSDGVYVTTPEVTKAKALVKIFGQLTNKAAEPRTLALHNVLKDPSGKIVSIDNFALGTTKPGQLIAFIHQLPALIKPQLWSPENPGLYTITSSLVDVKTNAILDELQHKTGFRWFKFDANSGFFLNGKPYKLIGASRHQDFKGMGNAVPSALQVKDIQLLKDMGGNFLRVAHYPQDQAVLDACDKLGILTSVEIPVVNEITVNKKFQTNAIRMQLEMIWQYRNHPSIVIWGYMNEILLKMKDKDDESKNVRYIENVRRLALSLNKATREADPSRYTMISNHGNPSLYQKAGLTRIPMLVGWNIYSGWYGGKLEDFGPALDKIHKEMPDVPFMVTEYGADADPRIHSLKPERFDKSEEYSVKFHQIYLKEILKRPFVSGAQVWNLADFNSETREETMPHMNNKGLLTIDRQPKISYYLYKAYLSHKAYVKIGVNEKGLRSGIAQNDNATATQPMLVFSNMKNAELFVNGKSLGSKIFKDHVATWNVPFRNGRNMLKVVAVNGDAKLEDHAIVEFKIMPELLKSKRFPFKEIAISLGDPRYFTDEANHKVWFPDQPYHTGSWGYVGGEVYHMEDSRRQPFGTDKGIAGTSLDPIYQTQRIGLKEYRLDVPDGKYEITMHFAELVGSEMKNLLPYNLLSSFKKSTKEDRVFNIYLENKLIASRLNLPKNVGSAKAATKKVTAIIKNNEGIRLQFEAIEGRPVLNALQVRKLD